MRHGMGSSSEGRGERAVAQRGPSTRCCGRGRDDPPSGARDGHGFRATFRWAPDVPRTRFPDGFLWGAATAAHQVEGGNRWNDWWAAEEERKLPRSGVACRHWERFAEDFDLARSWGHNAHRFSVEWSRVEPEPGRWNGPALDHYRSVVAALRERSLEPIVTLHHFTNPAWFARGGGWLQDDAPDLFRRYVARVVDALGDGVRWWLTVNEPTVWAKHAFVTGDWPPFHRGRWDRAYRTIQSMARAHTSAYRAIHDRCSGARVGLAHSAPWIEPCRPDRALDRGVAHVRDFLLNEALFRMIAARSADAPLDFIGVNYYTRAVVRHEWRGTSAVFGTECRGDHHGGPREWSEMGWEVHPDGLSQVLRRFSRYGLPLMVTENGLATDDEGMRSRVLADHLEALADAVDKGIEVRGYLCWTLMDNYEWALGMRPRFGLAGLEPGTLDRLPRPAAWLLADVCEENAVPRGGRTALVEPRPGADGGSGEGAP